MLPRLGHRSRDACIPGEQGDASSLSRVPHLFSYGTLQQSDVQRAQFGRLLIGRPDSLRGYRLDWLTITDPAVVAVSGSDRHPVMSRTGHAGDAVAGTLFEITEADLAAADDYEVSDYTRVAVRLESGIDAWTYLAVEVSPGDGSEGVA
ncbi:gamma-glutamylcyclotransferase [Actinopolymorpha pittospori]|uniref:Gamma-glutamylcyclotransferase (GGCT)/AIG2-like uncharacterized protein YtfP n=1 Tax=Actinopolymorpha pittospori TaxID=648752 RepID=A0A927MT54_9ACTN|nr:gamma-glutamylcyclotransferase (GGCT)/AIG2-like uncharacterized protein YtfP [Actinopolymorpha pittospori]